MAERAVYCKWKNYITALDVNDVIYKFHTKWHKLPKCLLMANANILVK